MSAKKVLSVGQCAADHGSISRLLREQFDAGVVGVDSAEDALAELLDGGFDLVLANRVFDLGGAGLDFISQVKADEKLKNLPVMLVSNYADAQEQATALGALPGFGKSSLRDPATHTKLADAFRAD
jgi:two-component system chemotaxis response regulator CheY